MNIRAELMPAEPESQIVQELAALAGEIVRLQDTRGDYEPFVVRFNEQAGTDLGVWDFHGMAGSEEAHTYVRRVLGPHPPLRNDIRDEEFIEIIRSIRAFETPDHEYSYWDTFLEINLRSRSLDDLLHGNHELTPKEILTEARKRRPIML